MVESLRERMIEGLKSSKIIQEAQLNKALEIQKKKGGSLGRILVEQGYISHKDLLVILSQQLNIPPIDLSKYKVDPELVKMIPEKMAKRYKLFPISKIGQTLTLAMADPTNIIAMDDIKTVTNYTVDLVLASESDIDNAIANYYKREAEEDIFKTVQDDESVDDFQVVEGDDEKIDISEISVESKKAPIVKLVSMILNEALASRASDIHIEPQEKALRVRYRIDGRLKESHMIPRQNQNAIIARLKIMSKLDITENRVPQDGRFKIRFRDREVDFRVSILPITFGNKIVLRALDRTSLSVGLEKLGYLPEPLDTFKKAIKRPYGMILITGPTGSGKSTTLYSILNQLNIVQRNIITIEDPVEYQLEGITQIQVIHDIGLSFANGLRSVLRQSPDIVMVGEIRDSETADIAIKASLTGQLVLSTLHTNDAASAITRLVDMGVEPFLIASSVIMTAAQRLCRKICPYCKEEYHVANSVLERVESNLDLKEHINKRTVFYRGKGCQRCNNTGYLGRMGTLETLMVDDTVREMIMRRASSDDIKRYVISKGMSTLRDNALRKFIMGLTTLEEVLRITSDE